MRPSGRYTHGPCGSSACFIQNVGRPLARIDRMKRPKRSARPPLRLGRIAGCLAGSEWQYRFGHIAVASSDVTIR